MAAVVANASRALTEDTSYGAIAPAPPPRVVYLLSADAMPMPRRRLVVAAVLGWLQIAANWSGPTAAAYADAAAGNLTLLLAAGPERVSSAFDRTIVSLLQDMGVLIALSGVAGSVRRTGPVAAGRLTTSAAAANTSVGSSSLGGAIGGAIAGGFVLIVSIACVIYALRARARSSASAKALSRRAHVTADPLTSSAMTHNPLRARAAEEAAIATEVRAAIGAAATKIISTTPDGRKRDPRDVAVAAAEAARIEALQASALAAAVAMGVSTSPVLVVSAVALAAEAAAAEAAAEAAAAAMKAAAAAAYALVLSPRPQVTKPAGAKPPKKKRVEDPQWTEWVEARDADGEVFFTSNVTNISVWYRPGEEIESLIDGVTGAKYYVDRMTAKTYWERPKAGKGGVNSWRAFRDRDGDCYYVNDATGGSAWKLPAGAVLHGIDD